MNAATVSNLTIVDHPLAQRLLTRLRDYTTPPNDFRRKAFQLSQFLAYEAMRDLAVREAGVETPLGPAKGVAVSDYVVIAPVLRAGLIVAEAAQEILPPTARVYHIGLKRDEETLQAISYYTK